jgi:hypothetical protein
LAALAAATASLYAFFSSGVMVACKAFSLAAFSAFSAFSLATRYALVSASILLWIYVYFIN